MITVVAEIKSRKYDNYKGYVGQIPGDFQDFIYLPKRIQAHSILTPCICDNPTRWSSEDIEKKFKISQYIADGMIVDCEVIIEEGVHNCIVVESYSDFYYFIEESILSIDVKEFFEKYKRFLKINNLG